MVLRRKCYNEPIATGAGPERAGRITAQLVPGRFAASFSIASG